MIEDRGGLVEHLPLVRGRVTFDAPIGKQTWFGVGGPAEVMFRPADAADLAAFLAALPPPIPVTVIGVGSNLLVRDGGIPGVTIRLGRGFAGISIAEEEMCVGAAALDRIVAFAAADAGLAGLEFLSGIPGSIGGGLRMNAGAYGREIKRTLASATVLDRSGQSHTVESEAMGLSYRHSEIDPGWVFIEARLRGVRGNREEIAARLSEIRAAREATQPVRARTGGSTFKNPPGEAAWRLIDAAGCRGLVRGGAMVSEKHTNFLINTGTATAADLEGLGEEVRQRVYKNSGMLLEWEIERIGRPLKRIEQPRSHTLSRRWPGGEGRVRRADEPVSGTAHLTLPSLSLTSGRGPRGPGGDGPLPLPPKGRRGALPEATEWSEGGL